MWVRLLREWHWYRKGSVLALPDDEGLDLIVSHMAIKAQRGDCMKDFSKPPRDKMLGEAVKSKRKEQKQKKRNHRSQAPTGAHGQ